jgi:DNA polymerase III epsilon subunit-like protein
MHCRDFRTEEFVNFDLSKVTADMTNKPTVISFVDTETTGLDPANEDIIQIAVMKVMHLPGSTEVIPVEEGTLEMKILPTKPVPAEAAAINGYKEEVWAAEAIPLAEAMEKFFKFIEWTNFGGQNPKFDKVFLEEAAKRCNLQWPRMSGYRLVAVEMLAWPLFLAGKIRNVKQETLAEYLGLGKQTHDAFDDIRQSVQIYSRLIGPASAWADSFDPKSIPKG